MKLLSALVSVGLTVSASAAFAEDYPWTPERPINIIVPWGAGGSTDQITRVTAGVLEEALGQNVVVINTPGAAGSVGTMAAFNADRDGYTWAAGAPKQLGTFKLLGQFDTFVDEWELYISVVNVPMVSVNMDSPYLTMDDLITAMKAEEIAVATAGVGSSGHSAIEALKSATGIKYRMITYDGGNPAVVATVSGEAVVTTQLAAEQIEMVRGGRLRPLAVLADAPLNIEGFGEVPSITDFTDTPVPPVATSFGLILPKDLPEEVLTTLNMIWDDVIADSEAVKAYAAEKGALFTPIRGEEAQKFVWPEIQADAWSFFDSGRTEMSPEEVGIPRP